MTLAWCQQQQPGTLCHVWCVLPAAVLAPRRTARASLPRASLCGGTMATRTSSTCLWTCPGWSLWQCAASATWRWTARACCCGPCSSWQAQTSRHTLCSSCSAAECGRCSCVRAAGPCRCAVLCRVMKRQPHCSGMRASALAGLAAGHPCARASCAAAPCRAGSL